MTKACVSLALVVLVLFSVAGSCWGLASNNIPLDSPIYQYLDKLAGLGLIKSEVKGIRPYAKAEAARLLAEAEENLPRLDGDAAFFAGQLIARLHDLIPREASLRKEPERAPWLDANPLALARLRYVYLDGIPRDYARNAYDPANQSAFGFIGGNLRPQSPAIVHMSGSEGTPLQENNEGINYGRGNNGEFRWDMEGFVKDKVSLLVEPLLLATPDTKRLLLQKGYVKIGSGGLELEAGRDANWFGPGYRGALTLSNNAKNFDLIKLSSPEPLDVAWVKKYLGDFKYAAIFSRFDETGTGANLRRPYFVGIKLALKPKPWFEIGGNFVRQEGGPGFSGSTSVQDLIFGGGYTNKSNTIAGIDLRFRLPWLRDSELYGEYVGEDSALFWPFVESYLAGFYIPRLTASGRDDLRFEYFWGSQLLYTDGKFPHGYTYEGMSPGHSQGGGAQEFFVRYSHWFSVRNNVAVEYLHGDRGKVGKIAPQKTEYRNGIRFFWDLPVRGDIDAEIMYGWERINNLNLVEGDNRSNQLVRFDLRYRY